MKRFILLLATLAATLGAHSQQKGSRVEESTLESRLLGSSKPYLVYLPAGYDEGVAEGRNYPVLYLLHGAGDNHTGWRDKGAMQRIVDERIEAGLALAMIVVMPDASGQGGVSSDGGTPLNRGYFNQPGWPYEDFFFTEFIPHIEKTYRAIADKRHRAVAGLSMGGGGSALYAMRHPEAFSSSCPLSGALSGMSREEHIAKSGPVGFLETATDTQIASLRTVRWWVDCGDDDFLWFANIEFYRLMREKNIPLQYRMRNGTHNWGYWQSALPDVLTFVSIGFSE